MTKLRALAALAGAGAIVGMGLLGMPVHSGAPGGTAVLAPATGPDQTLDEVTTTPIQSFRPEVTATQPVPPT